MCAFIINSKPHGAIVGYIILTDIANSMQISNLVITKKLHKKNFTLVNEEISVIKIV